MGERAGALEEELKEARAHSRELGAAQLVATRELDELRAQMLKVLAAG